jgi:hypothetical protein
LAAKIQKILALRGLSLGAVSRTSRSLAPHNRLQHIPHNLYSSLRNRLFSPNLYQVFALSVLTGYRFADWLAVFGFTLHDVPRLQTVFPALRTVELDARACQPVKLIPWFREGRAPDFSAPLMPLSRWLALTTPTFHPVPDAIAAAHRYAKIGSQDTFAFPELLPGSIVRITAAPVSSKPLQLGRKGSKKLFLVEQSKGLVCAQLSRSTTGKFVLCSRQLPYAPVELQEGRDALVCGAADFEIRSLENFDKPVVTAQLGRFWTPIPLPQTSNAAHVGEYIRKARIRAGLSFREASRRTRTIAKKLGDRRYYCAAGSLSDYEAQRLPPRHIHKLTSICAVYFAGVAGFLEAAGVSPDRAGRLAMPAQFLVPGADDTRPVSESSLFFSEMARRLGELPYFLRNSLESVFGLQNISVRDVFWAGGTRGFVHPPLAGALFLVVDRKRKNPRPALTCPKWAQPMYVVQQRGGNYLCGFCTLQNGMLILRCSFRGMPKLVRLRNLVDAEVVGKVVGIARRLP